MESPYKDKYQEGIDDKQYQMANKEVFEEVLRTDLAYDKGAGFHLGQQV